MKLRLITEVTESDLITVTPEWMARKYDEMNRLLFDGKLGDCTFNVFRTGRGSQGNTLGYFSMKGKNLKYNKESRKIFKTNFLGDKTYVDASNFVDICNPMIQLNGNYKWTEKAALSTLVHEMCHYYCNMNGFHPVQPHGFEFRNIAARVSSKSSDFFTVQRIASAEEMDELALDNTIKAKNQKREENKINRIIPLFTFRKNGRIELTNANNMNVVQHIVDIAGQYNNRSIDLVKICTDEGLKKIIWDLGYKASMTTYRYWDVTNDTKLINALKDYNLKTVYKG